MDFGSCRIVIVLVLVVRSSAIPLRLTTPPVARRGCESRLRGLGEAPSPAVAWKGRATEGVLLLLHHEGLSVALVRPSSSPRPSLYPSSLRSPPSPFLPYSISLLSFLVPPFFFIPLFTPIASLRLLHFHLFLFFYLFPVLFFLIPLILASLHIIPLLLNPSFLFFSIPLLAPIFPPLLPSHWFLISILFLFFSSFPSFPRFISPSPSSCFVFFPPLFIVLFFSFSSSSF